MKTNNKSTEKKYYYNLPLVKRLALKWEISETLVRQSLRKTAKSTTAATIRREYDEAQKQITPLQETIDSILDTIYKK